MRVERELLLIVAHGSSNDQAVIDRVHAHVERMRARVPHSDVRVGFVRGMPSLQEVLFEIGTSKVRTALTIVPFMMSAGYYADQVMPSLVREAVGKRVRVRITAPIGMSRRIASVLQRRALRLMAQRGWNMHDTAIVLVGHGTPRHPASRDTCLANAQKLSTRGWESAHAAFIDDEPNIAAVIHSLPSRRVIVLPFLIGGAVHAAVDVPQALHLDASPVDAARYGVAGGRELLLDAPIGVDETLSDIAADFAVRSYHAFARRSQTMRIVNNEPAVVHSSVRTGTVYIVGAGPGAPDLLTIRAHRLLKKADVVVHDRLVSGETLALARKDAQVIDVGKWPNTPQDVQESINDRLIAAARHGHAVVRLKGGDPFVFGRGSEEVDACRLAGVHVEVVPGISSALAAPAAAGIAVTARGISRGFAVVTAATANDLLGNALHVADYARIDTLVLMMARSRLAAVCAALIAAGRASTTPVACIERATLPGERVVRGTLATIAALATQAELSAPMVTVIGATAA